MGYVQQSDYRTSKGNPAPDMHWTGDDDAYEARYKIKTRIEKHYAPAQVVGDASRRYNCHALAHAGSHAWFNDITAFMRDDYEQFTPGNLKVGDVVVYVKDGERTHSGVITRLNGNSPAEIRSKWGAWSEVLHPPEKVPVEYGSILYYLRKRTPKIAAMDNTSRDVLAGVLANGDEADRLDLASTPEVFTRIARSLIDNEHVADFIANVQFTANNLSTLDKRALAAVAASVQDLADADFAETLLARYEQLRNTSSIDVTDIVICKALLKMAERTNVASWCASAVSLAKSLKQARK